MLKNKTIVLFLKTLAYFIAHRNFENLTPDIVQKYTSLSKSQLRKYETLSIKVKKAKLDFNFWLNCRLFNVVPKFLAFNLPYSNDEDIRFIRKRFLSSAIKKRKKMNLQTGKSVEKK